MKRPAAAADTPRDPAAAAPVSIMPGTDFTPAPPPPGAVVPAPVGAPVSGAASAAPDPVAGVVVVGPSGAPPPVAAVVPEQALAGRSHEVGSSWPSAEPSPPSWAAGPDAMAAQRHGACDSNMARIWAQHSAGGDEELLVKKRRHGARVACAGGHGAGSWLGTAGAVAGVVGVVVAVGCGVTGSGSVCGCAVVVEAAHSIIVVRAVAESWARNRMVIDGKPRCRC
ncbi:unnamed protein product [Urochloa humidicola]